MQILKLHMFLQKSAIPFGKSAIVPSGCLGYSYRVRHGAHGRIHWRQGRRVSRLHPFALIYVGRTEKRPENGITILRNRAGSGGFLAGRHCIICKIKVSICCNMSDDTGGRSGGRRRGAILSHHNDSCCGRIGQLALSGFCGCYDRRFLRELTGTDSSTRQARLRSPGAVFRPASSAVSLSTSNNNGGNAL